MDKYIYNKITQSGICVNLYNKKHYLLLNMTEFLIKYAWIEGKTFVENQQVHLQLYVSC